MNVCLVCLISISVSESLLSYLSLSGCVSSAIIIEHSTSTRVLFPFLFVPFHQLNLKSLFSLLPTTN